MTHSDRASVAEAMTLAVGDEITLTCECEATRTVAAKTLPIMDAKRAGWSWKGGEIRCPACRSAWLKPPPIQA